MEKTVLKNNTEPNDSEEEILPTDFDVVGRLPVEIIQKILFYLPPEDLRSATSCCLTWNDAVSNNDYFWKKLCLREGYFEVDEWKRSEFYINFLEKYTYWQGVYWYNYTIERNWETNNYREFNYELKVKRCNWYWCFGDTFACLSEDRAKLLVYNLKTKEIKPTVFSVDSDVHMSCLELLKSGKYIICFTYGAHLTVWNLDDGSTILHELWDHLTSISVDKNLIALVEMRGELKVFNMESGKIEYEARGKYSNGFIMDGRIVYTSKDHAIHILKWDDKSLITLRCCNSDPAENKFLVKNNLLLSFCRESPVSSNLTLCVWNITTKIKLHSTFLGPMLRFENPCFVNKYLCLMHHNSFLPVIELWDYVKGSQEVKVFCRSSRFFNSDDKVLNNNFIICLRAAKFSVWSLKKEGFIYDLNFTPNQFSTYHIVITDTTLAYVRSNSNRDQSTLFHLRDYEI